jgi:hypothetical protein
VLPRGRKVKFYLIKIFSRINPFSKKLMQIKSDLHDQDVEQFNYNRIGNLVDSNKLTVCIYDIEYEKGVEIDVNLRIIKSTEGYSELNLNNSLYLCGSSMDDNSSSFLIRCDPVKNGNNVTVLINSIHHHFLPSLLGYKNDYIVAIGGLNSVFCEIFSIKNNKWRNLPELPEERYKCSLISDDLTDFIYLFGGYNSNYKKNCTNILRLNMKTLMLWETIVVKDNSHLLGRNSSAVLKFDRANTVYILGGKDNNDLLTDSIVEFDLNSKSANLNSNKKIPKCSFKQLSGSDLNKSLFFFIDEHFFIHKISRLDFKINSFDFRDVSEGN